MSEYIEREAALAFMNEVEPLLCRNVVTHDIMSATKDADLVKYLQSIPAADVRPVVRGKWELKTFDDGYGEYQLYECDKCGAVTAQRRNYCPNCGADMREES